MTWTLEAGDTWGLEYQEHEEEETGQKIVRRLNPVGRWSPRDGLSMSSHLFPHLRKGFVGRDLTIISFHVRLHGTEAVTPASNSERSSFDFWPGH